MRMVGKVAGAEKGGRIVAAENFSNRNPPRLFRRGFAPARQRIATAPHSPPWNPGCTAAGCSGWPCRSSV